MGWIIAAKTLRSLGLLSRGIALATPSLFGLLANIRSRPGIHLIVSDPFQRQAIGGVDLVDVDASMGLDMQIISMGRSVAGGCHTVIVLHIQLGQDRCNSNGSRMHDGVNMLQEACIGAPCIAYMYLRGIANIPIA